MKFTESSQSWNTVKQHFYTHEKIMQIGQNGPLDNIIIYEIKFMRVNSLCIALQCMARYKFMRPRLTCIFRINKTRAQKCHFTVLPVLYRSRGTTLMRSVPELERRRNHTSLDNKQFTKIDKLSHYWRQRSILLIIITD
jgi:hypothetical protein